MLESAWAPVKARRGIRACRFWQARVRLLTCYLCGMPSLREPAEPALTHVLAADPSLADDLPADAAEQARLFAVARSQWVAPGPWHPDVEEDERAGHLGLLILEGLVARHARLVENVCIELLGQGDLLRPWQADHSAPFVAGESHWEVLEATHVAVLDRRFTALVGRWPEVVGALAERAVRRSRDMALTLAVAQIPKVEVRVLVLLWHIAGRWGRPDADGFVVPVRLTHDVLARMVTARRPTATIALGRLEKRGVLSRRPDGLLVLHGDAPSELRSLRGALG
jgi:CRP/FNR family cyclic AMP-dependent transcriptional regulator